MGSSDFFESNGGSGGQPIETESMVTSGANQRRYLVAFVAVALLGFVGWQIFTPEERATSDEVDGSAGFDVNDFEEDSAAGIVPELPHVSSVPPSTDSPFPLFPDSPGLALVLANPIGEVLLIDADDGSIEFLPESALDPRNLEVSQDVPFLGRVGGTLVVRGRDKTFGYPLDGGAPIDFGEADDVILTRDLIVLLDYPETLHSPLRLRAVAPDGDSDFDWVDTPDRQVAMNRSGLLPMARATYEFTGDEFNRVSSNPVVASGENHIVELRCDAVIVCTYHRIDRDTGESQLVPIRSTDDWWQPNELSPDGRWMYSVEQDESGEPVEIFTDFETGARQTRRGGISEEAANVTAWDPMSRYAATVGANGLSLTIFDTETRQSRTVDRSALGVGFRFGSAVVVDLDDA